MSVGRVTIKNFDKIENELCWKNGFKELFINKYSVKQIKHLDRNRSKLFYKLKKELEEIKGQEKTSEQSFSKKRQIIHFNKPFSYYFQVLERKVIKEES